jgi:dihydrodipicolinate synthase/N-acetylneuraminate lyase
MMLRLSDDVVWTGDAEEVRLYHTAAGDFQTLNATASRIWHLITQGKPVPEIVADLVTDFAEGDAAEARVIEHDVREFVTTLRAAGLVMPAAG